MVAAPRILSMKSRIGLKCPQSTQHSRPCFVSINGEQTLNCFFLARLPFYVPTSSTHAAPMNRLFPSIPYCSVYLSLYLSVCLFVSYVRLFVCLLGAVMHSRSRSWLLSAYLPINISKHVAKKCNLLLTYICMQTTTISDRYATCWQYS